MPAEKRPFEQHEAGAALEPAVRPCPGAMSGGEGCLHLPPYGDHTPVQPDVWTKEWTEKGVRCHFRDGINHFEPTTCLSQDNKWMLQCKFCPWTRLPELKNGKFSMWKNPIACRSYTGDQVRDARNHVLGELKPRKKAGASAQPKAEADSTVGMAAAGMANPDAAAMQPEVQKGGKRGWHQFWYAVHSLYPQVAGGAAAGGAAAGGAAGGGGPPGDPLMIEWFQNKVKDYPACRIDFEDAGLLVPDGAGAEYGIVDKFSMADEVLRILREHYPGMMAPPKVVKRRRPAPRPAIDIPPSTSSDADIAASFLSDSTADAESFDDGEGSSNCVKTEVHSPDRGQEIAHWSPQSPIPPPPAEADSPHSFFGAYSICAQDPVLLEWRWDDDIVSPFAGASSGAADGGAASGAAVQPLQSLQVSSTPSLAEASATDPAGGLGRCAHHRPVFNVFLDAMTGVVFQTPQSERDWNSYDVNSQDFERSQEFGLAQVIGDYLHREEVSSTVLNSFNHDLRYSGQAGPLAYFQPLQAMQAPAFTPVVTASLGAIYCYWRIERELIHTFYFQQLARWQGDDIRGRLVDILRQLQQGADPAHLEQELKAFFAVIDREIRLRLKECSNELQYYCSNTGSFAQVVRAARIWCFFLVLRLRHDADFSRALWDKGFRFVAALLDPLRVAPRGRDEWIAAATGLLSGTSPGGGAGQGGGGQAVNPFIDTPDETTEMRLVAQLLAAEGKEVDVAARAEEGEDVDPPVLQRKSLTAARLHLVSQGLVCVLGAVGVGCGCGCGCGCLYVLCAWGGSVGGWMSGLSVCVCVCASVHLCFCHARVSIGLSLPPPPPPPPPPFPRCMCVCASSITTMLTK
jgi:hypothetical protein